VGAGEGARAAEARPAEAPPAEEAPPVDARKLYALYCMSCHGVKGDGAGPVALSLQPRPARFTDPAFWGGRDDARIRQAIVEGAASVGGSPLMAGFGAQLDDAAVDALVAWMRDRWAP